VCPGGGATGRDFAGSRNVADLGRVLTGFTRHFGDGRLLASRSVKQRVSMFSNPLGSTNQAVTKPSLPVVHKCLLAQVHAPFYAPTATLQIGSDRIEETRELSLWKSVGIAIGDKPLGGVPSLPSLTDEVDRISQRDPMLRGDRHVPDWIAEPRIVEIEQGDRRTVAKHDIAHDRVVVTDEGAVER
jgi:hypothetical protein